MPKKGDPFNKFITPNWYNRVTESMNRKPSNPSPPILPPQISVQNNTGFNFSKWEAVRVANFVPTYNIRLKAPSWEITGLSADDPQNFVILEENVPAGRHGVATTSGVTWVYLSQIDPAPAPETGHNGQSQKTSLIVDSQGVLRQCNHGRGEVQSIIPADSIYLASVVLSSKNINTLYTYRMESDWLGGVCLGLVTTMDNKVVEAAPINDPEGIFNYLGNGSIGYCMRDTSGYYAVQAGCTSGTGPETTGDCAYTWYGTTYNFQTSLNFCNYINGVFTP